MQRALLLGAREFVGGQREMIHADVHIARVGQLLDHELQQREPRGGRRQCRGVDLPLHLEELRHVRVAEHRNALGREQQHRVERAPEAFDVLMRQPVNQVDADRFEAAGARRVHHVDGQFQRLHAVDRLLHERIEVLHTQAQPVESEAAQMRDRLRRSLARVDLDGIFGVALGQQREVLARGRHQRAHFVERQERGRAAAPVQLRNGAFRVELRCLDCHFAHELLDVGFRAPAVLCRDLVAAAIEADGVAERNMEVEREVGFGGAGIGCRMPVVVEFEIVAELQGGWVGRIPWAVRAVLGEQVGAKEKVGVAHAWLSGRGRGWRRACIASFARAGVSDSAR